MPRRRNKKIAMVLAAVFVVILFLELLAIFSPAIGGLVASHRDIEIVALAPPGGVDKTFLKTLAENVGAKKYRLQVLDNIPATNATKMFYALIIYEKGQPVAVTLVPGEANATAVTRVVEALMNIAQRLPSNETVLYLGGNQLLRIPRNETNIMSLIENIYKQLAQHPPIPAHTAQSNTTTGQQG